MQNRLNILRDMEKENPNDPFYKYAIALELVKSDISEAKKYFELVLHDFPTYLPSYYQLGKILQKTGQIDDAVQIFKNGILIAQSQNELHTLKELKGALFELEDED